MDVALLLISFFSFGCSVACLVILKYSIDRLTTYQEDYKQAAEGMRAAGKILGELHNEQIARVKTIGDKVENLEIRLQGVSVQPKRGF